MLCYTSPNAVTPYSIDISVPLSSSNILPVAYAMMESHMDMEAAHQAGRTASGLCHMPSDSYENTPTGCFHAGEGAGTPAWTMEW